MFLVFVPCLIIIAGVTMPNMRGVGFGVALAAGHVLGDLWSPTLTGWVIDTFAQRDSMATVFGQFLSAIGAVAGGASRSGAREPHRRHARDPARPASSPGVVPRLAGSSGRTVAAFVTPGNRGRACFRTVDMTGDVSRRRPKSAIAPRGTSSSLEPRPPSNGANRRTSHDHRWSASSRMPAQLRAKGSQQAAPFDALPSSPPPPHSTFPDQRIQPTEWKVED